MPRPARLDPDDLDDAALYGRPWWQLKGAWPESVRFEDGPTERVLDQRMPFPEPTYTSSAGLCVDGRFAESEFP
jgi:hypothetical protein